jgi:hypothetical protein
MKKHFKFKKSRNVTRTNNYCTYLEDCIVIFSIGGIWITATKKKKKYINTRYRRKKREKLEEYRRARSSQSTVPKA